MNYSSVLTTTFCRRCKKFRSCLDGSSVSNYRYICKECARSENLIGQCRECGREGISKELLKHDGYCNLCEHDHVIECKLCGAETYNYKDGICKKCATGENVACNCCGSYFNKKNLSSDGLCNKCSLKIHKRLRESQVNEVVECIECGRECYVNDLENGLCIYCKCDSLESEIKKLKRRKKKAYY